MATYLQAALLGKNIARIKPGYLETGRINMLQTHTIETHIRTSNRARRVTLRVIPYPLRAELVLPHGSSHKKALAFLESKRHWIEEKAGSFLPQLALSHGAVVPVLGNEITIMHTGAIRGLSRWEDAVLWVSGLPEHCEKRVIQALKMKLQAEVLSQAAKYAALLECSYQQITLKETSSRWGSCSSQGNLSFSWKLIFAPLPVLHYVIAHEVAHLRELNHSARFWQLVHILCPEFKQHRAWLKLHGLGLHRYGGNALYTRSLI